MRSDNAGNDRSLFIATALYLRGLGLVYLVAFLSYWVQAEALVGARGILPVGEHLEVAKNQLGTGAYWKLPTWLWLGAGDGALHLLCALGTFIALYCICFPFAAIWWLLLWSLYLSLVVAGQTFFNFQWDALLLEVGLLAVFLAPCRLRPRLRSFAEPSAAFIWLHRWLLCRFMLLSGLVKIASGDPVWRDLTALEYHYMTQPLPPWTAWYVHHLPAELHKVSTAIMFFLELVVPLLVFWPRPLRLVAALLLALLQVVIIATGNYCFFNVLTILLCVPLVDDAAWRSLWGACVRFGARLRRGCGGAPRVTHGIHESDRVPGGAGSDHVASERVGRSLPGRSGPHVVTVPAALALFLLSLPPTLSTVLRTFDWPRAWLGEADPVLEWTRPLRSVNGYGLFADMTTERPEIVVEGSDDGITWKSYEFVYKPGRLDRRPAFVQPHMPRLDWQMWFAALGGVRQNFWFQRFCFRLLEGEETVLKLLENNPFPETPPRYLRAQLYSYEFTSPGERRASGEWWRRRYVREYLPRVSLLGR